MRLHNNSQSPRYSATFTKTINPGRKSMESDVLVKFIDKLLSESKGFLLSLSKADVSAIQRLCERARTSHQAVVGQVSALVWDKSDPTGATKVYNQTEPYYKAKQAVVSAMMKDHAEKERRINSESNFIGPDGNPVNPHMETITSKYADVQPKILEGEPTSPKDIIAHNKAIKAGLKEAAAAASKSDTQITEEKAKNAPRSQTPGMPLMPKVDPSKQKPTSKSLLEQFQGDIRSDFRSRFDASTAEILAKAESGNLNRKP